MIPLNETELTDCVVRLADIQARQAELQRQADSLKTILRALGETRQRRFGDLMLTVTPNRRFDANKARDVLSAPVLQQISVSRPDPATARKVLPPDVYAECCTDGDMIVRLT